jgi:hypothetical protein
MNRWLPILAAIALAGYLLAAHALTAKAHDAITGWHYPIQCCGEGDCAEAVSATRNQDGSLTVTTRHGTATFPASFGFQASPDGLIHACFTPSRLYCLYLTTGF